MNSKIIEANNKTIDVIGRERRLDDRKMNMTQRMAEPWRKKSEFKQIYQKASPIDKYMPKFK